MTIGDGVLLAIGILILVRTADSPGMIGWALGLLMVNLFLVWLEVCSPFSIMIILGLGAILTLYMKNYKLKHPRRRGRRNRNYRWW